MKTAYLHVGTMKTGTSTVQDFLEKNQNELIKRNKIYWSGWPMRNHIRISEFLTKVPPDASIIISDEGLWHFSFTKRSNTTKIIEFLKEKKFNVKIIVYFRRPDEFLESWYLQGLKFGSGAPLISDFLKSPSIKSALNYDFKLNRFAAICGEENIIIRPFEKSQLIASSIIDDFCQQVAITTQDLIKPSNKNITPDPNSLMLGRLLKESCNISDLDEFANLTKFIGGAKSKEKESIFYRDEISHIYDEYKTTYKTVQQRYAAHLPDHLIEDWTDPCDIKLSDTSIRGLYEKYMTQITKQA